MAKVLFVTQTLGHKTACGIGLIGKLLGESLVKSRKHDFEVLYTDSKEELESSIKRCKPSVIIYNYHSITTPWIHSADSKKFRNKYYDVAHVMLHHDFHQKLVDTYRPRRNFGFEYLISADPTLKGNRHIFVTNRLTPPFKPKVYKDRGIPVIGFQGFGPRHKGIHKIAEKVQEEFDEAIIRLHIPYSFYGDPEGREAKSRVEEVRNIIKKPGIKIEASHDLLSTKEIVEFLSENTINCYFYDYLDGAGLASSPDYALSAKRPIAVTKSHQLRNFKNLSPSICIEDNSLKDIISFGLKPLEELHEKYTEGNVIKDYEEIIDKIISVPRWKVYLRHLFTKFGDLILK